MAIVSASAVDNECPLFTVEVNGFADTTFEEFKEQYLMEPQVSTLVRLLVGCSHDVFTTELLCYSRKTLSDQVQ